MWSTLVDVFKGIISGATGGGIGGLQMAGTIWTTVTDFRMWRSLGWLLLGVLLMLIGFVVWNRHAIGSAAATVAGAV